MAKLIIMGRLHGLNDYIAAERSNRYSAAGMKRQDMNLVLTYARVYLRGWKASGRVQMRYTWYEKNQRRDMDNVSSYGRKVIQDALVEGGYLPNDGWKNIAGFSDDFAVDKNNPRIEVEIEEERQT